jgi:hypothetical protein
MSKIEKEAFDITYIKYYFFWYGGMSIDAVVMIKP